MSVALRQCDMGGTARRATGGLIRHAVPAWISVVLIGLCTVGCQSTETLDRRTGEPDKIASINTLLGIQYIKDGEHELAMKKLQKAIDAEPNYADAHNAFGLLYAQLKQYDKADASFRTAIRLDPDNANVLNNYGQFLCQRERYEEGQKMFLEAINEPLYRTPEVAYANAGTCALAGGDTEQAEVYLREALQINPRMAQALLQMSQLSYDQQRYLPARGYLQRYLEVAKHTARTLWLGIQIERQLGDKDAIASYSLMLERGYPDSVETGLMLKSRTQ